jgi:glycosyltransferase involved in cell wall biosynthesis
MQNKIAIIVVAYNHSQTLAKVLDRIPQDVWERVTEVVVLDDASKDDTYLVGKGYQSERAVPKLTMIRNEVNLGYGGNQKKGYLYCIDKGYDIAVLLHGDGQYAPEIMWDLIEPLYEGRAEAVFGSRMMVRGQARSGGMPLYKYAGNRILTKMENTLVGSSLSEFHSGYRAYDLHALNSVPFTRNTNDFHFDTEIIIQLVEKGCRIREVPIPTYYGDEICYVNGMKYARDVARTAGKYWLWKRGFAVDNRFEVHSEQSVYESKGGPYSSHSIISRIVRPGTVLDIGCGDTGVIGRQLIAKGCSVTGVDIGEKSPPGYERFYQHDLNNGIPSEIDLSQFATILLPDVLEHLVHPEKLIDQLAHGVSRNAVIVASVPNVANWYVRLSLLLGFFPYTRKGILDNTHLRFFTVESFKRLWRENGFIVRSTRYSVLPFEIFSSRGPTAILSFGYRALTTLLPGLFAYQTIIVAQPSPQSRELELNKDV